jgi:hypothetical protein
MLAGQDRHDPRRDAALIGLRRFDQPGVDQLPDLLLGRLAQVEPGRAGEIGVARARLREIRGPFQRAEDEVGGRVGQRRGDRVELEGERLARAEDGEFIAAAGAPDGMVADQAFADQLGHPRLGLAVDLRRCLAPHEALLGRGAAHERVEVVDRGQLLRTGEECFGCPPGHG